MDVIAIKVLREKFITQFSIDLDFLHCLYNNWILLGLCLKKKSQSLITLVAKEKHRGLLF